MPPLPHFQTNANVNRVDYNIRNVCDINFLWTLIFFLLPV